MNEYPSYTRTPEDVRMRRDRRIAATDWLVQRHQEQAALGVETSLSAQEYDDLLAHRQALRDVPDQSGFPENVDWPEPPEAAS